MSEPTTSPEPEDEAEAVPGTEPGSGTQLPFRPERVADALPWGVRIAAAWSWRLLAVIALIAVVILAIIELRYLVIPMLVAILIGALLVPLVDWLVKKRWPRWLAVAVAEIGLIAVVSGLMVLVVQQVVMGREALQRQSLAAYESFKQFLLDSPLAIDEHELTEWINTVLTELRENTQALLSGALSIGSTVGHLVAGILLALFATIFILLDGRSIWSWLVGLFPKRARRALDGGGKAGWVTLVNFVRVQILVASIDAIGIGVGAAVLGLPLALPVAVLVFLGSFVPIIGAVVTGAVAVFIALVYKGWVIALIMLAIVLVVQQVEGHVLQPLIMGNAVKVHPLAVVIAVAGGAMLAGIAGALFAVPLVALLNSMIGYIVRGDWRSNPDPTLKDVIDA